jgi:hypothetical protein
MQTAKKNTEVEIKGKIQDAKSCYPSGQWVKIDHEWFTNEEED